MNLSKRDKQLIWHPFTQEKTAPEVISIKRAEGAYLYDEQDKAYLDLISSWWVNLHGHAHPKIAESIYEQALKLEHVIFAGFTHEPAVHLCEALQKILPPSLGKFFFSDNGSTAVEIAIKMAYQYWQNLGHSNKTLFLSLEGGYHGDTFGAMSLGSSGFHDQFKDLFFKVLTIPYPDTWDDDHNVLAKEHHALSVLDHYLTQYQDKIAAIVLEPLIQGSSGMRICRPEFLKTLIEKIREKNILVIFDEVMTGFCRTGTYFALDQLDIIPDFLCISKGLTGGFLPLSLTITTEVIYNAFLSDDFNKAFIHGHSYTANPLACTAALTSLALLREVTCQKAIQEINLAHKKGIQCLKEHCDLIEKTRIIGTICAFDLILEKDQMLLLKTNFLEAGLLIRPLGNTVYLLPPYCVSQLELEKVYNKMIKLIKKVRS